jgi:hypothetical protein
MERLLSEQPAIDAVFAASDLMALGVMRAIERSGRRVHDDIAVVGFDDVAESRDARPPLTTVRQPIEDLGRTMSRAVLERINGGGARPRDDPPGRAHPASHGLTRETSPAVQSLAPGCPLRQRSIIMVGTLEGTVPVLIVFRPPRPTDRRRIMQGATKG